MQSITWETEEPLDNFSAMAHFIDVEMYSQIGNDYEVIETDGTQCVISNGEKEYVVNVYGNGDFYSHVAEFNLSNRG